MRKQFKHIVSNPDILNGKPIVKNTRISVSMILEWLATGGTIQSIAAQHPLLTEEGVKEAIRHASHFDKNDILLDLAIA
jgi:uncharacterized protein (DUF433 family)